MTNVSSSPRGPLPPVFLFAAIALMVLLHLFVPGTQLVSSPWRFVPGALFLVLGLWLNVWADKLFKQAGTSVKPFEPTTVLITRGPFAFSRHPMYLGMTFVLVGIVVALGSATPLLVVPLFVWQAINRFIIPEERKLENTFGWTYTEYKSRVRRWL